MSNIILIFVVSNQLKRQTMKLTNESLVNVVDSLKFRRFQQGNLYDPETGSEPIYMNGHDELINLYKETDFRKLVFSSKSRQNLNDYKCSDTIYVDVLRSLPSRKDVIQVDDSTCIIYRKTEKFVMFVIHFKFPNTEKIGSFFMYIDLETGEGTRSSQMYLPDGGLKQISVEETVQYYGLFMSTITYLELTPVTLNVILGGEKRGDIMRGNNIKNESKSTVIQVNSNWNVGTVRMGEFNVRGHYRLMLVGKGRTRYEYVFIRPFKKGIIHRLPQKMSIEPMTVEQLN